MDASGLIRLFDLKPHPEGGYYRQMYQSEEVIKAECLPGRFTSDRNLYSSILFLLDGDNFSAFHRLKADEIWHFYYGNRILLYTISSEGNLKIHRLGWKPHQGDAFQVRIAHGYWMAAEVENRQGFGLAGCTLSPAFHFHDFELASPQKLIRDFPHHATIINRLTRAE